MDEADARRVLLLRAYEDPPVAPWSAQERDAISRDVNRGLGADTPAQLLLARRARLALDRLLPREPAARRALAASAWPGWAGPLLVVLAGAVGLALDGLGGAQHVNLFALPLLGMLAWNVIVYMLLALHALGALRRPGSEPATRFRPRLAAWLTRRHGAAGAPLARFAADWARASGPLQTARLTAWMHAAAAALALGVLASMYLRGSFFEFRAGWDSTFFDATTLHALIGALLGPAAWLSGIALPDAAAFATLRLSSGGGEIAARWIHLYAITIALVVLLPRALLAGWAAWRAARLSRRIALPLQERYFRRLLPHAPVPVLVLPYSYQLAAPLAGGIAAALADDCDGPAQVRLAPNVPLGGEEKFERWWPAATAGAAATGLRVALVPLTATPERETHAAFLRALAARTPAGTRLLVLVDESGFRTRFGSASARLEERRATWQRFVHDLGLEARFADLSAAPPP